MGVVAHGGADEESDKTHWRNVCNFSQNSGFEIVVWKGVSDIALGDAGMFDVSKTKGMSTSFSPGLGVRDGDGDSTTEGIRP